MTQINKLMKSKIASRMINAPKPEKRKLTFLHDKEKEQDKDKDKDKEPVQISLDYPTIEYGCNAEYRMYPSVCETHEINTPQMIDISPKKIKKEKIKKKTLNEQIKENIITLREHLQLYIKHETGILKYIDDLRDSIKKHAKIEQNIDHDAWKKFLKD